MPEERTTPAPGPKAGPGTPLPPRPASHGVDPGAPLEIPGRSRPHPRLDHVAHALGADDALPIDPDLDPDDPRVPSPAHRPHAVGRPRRGPVVVAAIFAGGFLGTLGRYGVAQAWPAGPGHFPAATFVINTSGAFLLGLLLTVLLERFPHRMATLRPFLATGLLGGWTTYSTLAVESVTLAKGGHVAQGAGYVAITLVCGVTAAAFGIGAGRSRALALPTAPDERAMADR